MKIDYQALETEQPNPATARIDMCDTLDMLRLINQQDALVARAVERELPNIARAVDMLYGALSGGGSMFYVGAGTSGRLGVLDASECPPTFSAPPEQVQAYIAGGDPALRTAVEGYEDDYGAGYRLAGEIGVTERDVLVGITASGAAAYVLGAAQAARDIGAKTVALVTNQDTRLGEICEVTIAPIVGPEAVLGSTRMKSGTAQKMVLNMLTTGAMIKLGKVYGNLMVDLKASNQKLRERALRIVSMATGADEAAAREALERAGMHAKLAIMLIQTGLDAPQARRVLEAHGGRLREAIAASDLNLTHKKR
ncbi:MAG: N-acetylmuramic acid 6-phosphate etherase [Clostridia bacterium]|nr:N-acetylmuramic acid 6-phosphate etherase [Clostridia bacterium]